MLTIDLTERQYWFEIAEKLAFLPCLTSKTYMRDSRDIIDEFCEELDIYMNCGCTKYAFISNDSDWVLKTRFNDSRIDYCRQEYDNYQLAKEENLEPYFAKIVHFCTINGRDFYLQEKVHVNEDVTSDSFFNYYLEDEGITIEDISDDDYEYDRIWDLVSDMSDYERVEAVFGRFDELQDFLFANDINDLHEGNIGYVDRGAVLMDYSGY